MNTGTTLMANMGAAQTFELRQGWTLRKVVTALAREWLTPFRAEVTVKSARRWTILPIVEEPANGEPLWAEGIPTAEYEHRLERPDLVWLVQARAGHAKNTPKGIVLARLTMNPHRPGTIDMVCSQDALPEALIDPEKLAAFLEAHHQAGTEGLCAGLLIDHGFRIAS